MLKKSRQRILVYGAGRNKKVRSGFIPLGKLYGMKKRFFMLASFSLYRQKLLAISFIILLFVSCSSPYNQKSQATGEYEYVYNNIQWQPTNEPNLLTIALSLPGETSSANIVSVKISQRNTEVLAANFKTINREYWYKATGKIIYLFWNSHGNPSQTTVVKVKLNR